ncbi:hypothetical protein SAMN04487969_104174 [Paenibacillus algorifonticola]|uniref:Uncharacterized protein n=1 Tax=Paenibacillus algorifonticola TaxID=684063 RepID=A0A1I2BZV7_9BACL|nr:hypothetical protein [Paenibacillus algorifonticola]SFE61515.1 hypothetical protein SAMN04487969_104174 [Paenibacillus algorifonticola]
MKRKKDEEHRGAQIHGKRNTEHAAHNHEQNDRTKQQKHQTQHEKHEQKQTQPKKMITIKKVNNKPQTPTPKAK